MWIADIINAIGYRLSKNEKYEKFSLKLYKKFGSKLQPCYDIIKDYELSEETKAILDKLFKALPDDIAKMLLAYVINMYDKAGAIIAEGQIKQFLGIIKHFTY